MENSEITQRRLKNQGLSKQVFSDPVDVVTQLGAVQSQDYAGAKWALGQRLGGITDSQIDAAINAGKILRTHVLRPTWHFVSPADIHWILMLTAPRVHAANAYYYRKTGVDAATVRRSNKVIAKALRGGTHLMRTELATILEKSGVQTGGDQRLTYLVMRAELDGVICSGARKGKQFTYALLEERAPQGKTWNRDEALAEMTKRYFRTRGPATIYDFSWWSGLTVTEAKTGIEMVKSDFDSEMLNGQVYWFDNTNPPAKKILPAAHLLPNFDEYFIGFKDRSAIGGVAKQVGIQSDDPALLAHIVIYNGQIVGGWKRTLKKNEAQVEISPITELTKDEKQAVISAAERYGNFLELPVSVTFGNYQRAARKSRSFYLPLLLQRNQRCNR